jgi:hypothetical protein
MDNPNTNIIQETQNGDKNNKKQNEPHQSKWRVNPYVIDIKCTVEGHYN